MASFGGTVSPWAINPGAFFPPDRSFTTRRPSSLHAALLRQAFAHCARFPTAASRRSLGRVSVPVWLIILSDQLPVVALVSRYLTNKLIGRGPISRRRPKLPFGRPACAQTTSPGISPGFPELSQSLRQVAHVLLTRSPLSGDPKVPFALDLHVLGTPPAFVLSQDQTLREVLRYELDARI